MFFLFVFFFIENMRFFSIGLACAALLACAVCAEPSVRLPAGFVAPSGTRFGGELVYQTLAHSLHTLPRRAAVATLATAPASAEGSATLLGAAAQKQAVLVAVPEALAPADATGALADAAFPLDEMARTLATGLVQPGASPALQGAFARGTVRALAPARSSGGAAAVSRGLGACGIAMEFKSATGAFTLEGAAFDAADADAVLAPALLLCAPPAEAAALQVVVADLRPAHAAAVAKYGAESAQAAAVAQMTAEVLASLQARARLFVLAADGAFFAEQQRPGADFAVFAPRLGTAAAVASKMPDPDTSITQITIWFVVLMVVVVVVFVFATCGVGLDIEKDTLLYQTTCLRGQPMF